MNELINIQNEITMTSLEIAELTGKRHDNILRDIKEQLGQLGGLLKFEQTYTHPQNKQTYKMYRLPKREVLILISGYSVQLRAKIIDKLEELEKQVRNQTPQLPQTYLEALESLVESEKRNQALQAKIEEDKPKVEFFDAVADSKDAISIGEVAKTLNMGIGRNRLFEILRNKSILQADNIPYQKYIDAGCFRVIEQKYTRPDGETHISLKTLVYQKGLNYIRRVVEQEQSKGEI